VPGFKGTGKARTGFAGIVADSRHDIES
jgi:hypothetical protein